MKYSVVDAPDHFPQLPSWMKLAKLKSGSISGSYALLDTRRDRGPFIAFPAGMATIGISSDDVVVDIGAYVGSFSIRCARLGATVSSYEPNPLSAAVLRLSNEPRVTVHQAAVVGSSMDSTVFMASTTSLGLSNSIVRAPRNAVAMSVPAVHYRAAIHGATVVKIDAEGAEYSFGIGIECEPQLRAVLLSFHDPGNDSRWRDRAAIIIGDLEREGFKATKQVKHPLCSGSYNSEGVWTR